MNNYQLSMENEILRQAQDDSSYHYQFSIINEGRYCAARA